MANQHIKDVFGIDEKHPLYPRLYEPTGDKAATYDLKAVALAAANLLPVANPTDIAAKNAALVTANAINNKDEYENNLKTARKYGLSKIMINGKAALESVENLFARSHGIFEPPAGTLVALQAQLTAAIMDNIFWGLTVNHPSHTKPPKSTYEYDPRKKPATPDRFTGMAVGGGRRGRKPSKGSFQTINPFMINSMNPFYNNVSNILQNGTISYKTNGHTIQLGGGSSNKMHIVPMFGGVDLDQSVFDDFKKQLRDADSDKAIIAALQTFFNAFKGHVNRNTMLRLLHNNLIAARSKNMELDNGPQLAKLIGDYIEAMGSDATKEQVQKELHNKNIIRPGQYPNYHQLAILSGQIREVIKALDDVTNNRPGMYKLV